MKMVMVIQENEVGRNTILQKLDSILVMQGVGVFANPFAPAIKAVEFYPAKSVLVIIDPDIKECISKETIDLLEQLKNKNLRVIVCSNDTRLKTMAESMGIVISHFFKSPFDTRELAQVCAEQFACKCKNLEDPRRCPGNHLCGCQ